MGAKQFAYTPESRLDVKPAGAARARLAESVTTARAALLARRGKLKQAEALLEPLAAAPGADIGTLDLLAKIYAQQSKIEAARKLWLLALQQAEPSDTRILRALLRCARALKSKNALAGAEAPG